MRMAKRIVSGKAFLGQTWARTSILFPSLSRAINTLGSSILKSPPLVSLDHHDEWSYGFSHPDNAPTRTCTGKQFKLPQAPALLFYSQADNSFSFCVFDNPCPI